jgi:hypothetical protein
MLGLTNLLCVHVFKEDPADDELGTMELPENTGNLETLAALVEDFFQSVTLNFLQKKINLCTLYYGSKY